MNDCLFCKIATGEIPSEKVYEDDDVFAFLDISPVNVGHTLVIPKKHFKDMTDTPPELIAKLFTAVQSVAKGVVKAVSAPAYNVASNIGAEAGQVIFHTHIHVIPRFSDDGLKHWSKKEITDEERVSIAEAVQKELK